MDLSRYQEGHLVKLKPNTNPFKMKNKNMKVKHSYKTEITAIGELIHEQEIQNM